MSPMSSSCSLSRALSSGKELPRQACRLLTAWLPAFGVHTIERVFPFLDHVQPTPEDRAESRSASSHLLCPVQR